MISAARRTSARLIAIAVSASNSARSRSARAAAWRSCVVSPRHSRRISGNRYSSAKKAIASIRAVKAPALANVRSFMATQREPKPRPASATTAWRTSARACSSCAILASKAGAW
ncbi:Uncharacterised protein [Mycobacterium tuberculosis]|uniref:Uncharacterized protein n=1 Tax=Mycobacterium tuberculosis TaxID=1773 RepID=A0A0U0T0X4_MYCTX|nr:Uncharacterised protein [Mycobacterium tuberculosis]